MEVLGICWPYFKRYIQEHQSSAFFYIAKKLRFRCFRECWFWRKQISQFENDTSLKKICYGTFRYLSTLRKKVLSGALVNCFFLYDSNNSDSAVFGNGGFAEIKDHSFRTTSFQKKFFWCRSFRYFSTLLKGVFSGAPVKCFFLYLKN